MELIDGKATAAKIKEEIAAEVEQIVANGDFHEIGCEGVDGYHLVERVFRFGLYAHADIVEQFCSFAGIEVWEEAVRGSSPEVAQGLCLQEVCRQKQSGSH